MALLKSNTIIYGTSTVQGQLTVGSVSSNASINTATGSLVVVGGLGVSGNVYTSNIILSSTSSGITFGDATIQTSAGATYSGTGTLTNKRIDPRVSTTTSGSSLTPDISAYDSYNYTALATGLTINIPTGTPVDGNRLTIRILDNGTSQTLTWNTAATGYTAIGVTLPTATTVNKTTYVGCVYNSYGSSGTGRWDVIAVTTQA